jgi:hypothetical protein
MIPRAMVGSTHYCIGDFVCFVTFFSSTVAFSLPLLVQHSHFMYFNQAAIGNTTLQNRKLTVFDYWHLSFWHVVKQGFSSSVLCTGIKEITSGKTVLFYYFPTPYWLFLTAHTRLSIQGSLLHVKSISYWYRRLPQTFIEIQ